MLLESEESSQDSGGSVSTTPQAENVVHTAIPMREASPAFVAELHLESLETVFFSIFTIKP